MTIQKIWAVYFSPTGGTKKCVTTIAKCVAQNLNLPYQEYDFTSPNARVEELSFGKEDLVVFGMPVIAGRIPNLMLPYVTQKIKASESVGVPVVSFGNRNYDDALIELRDILENVGMKTIAGGGFVSEHSFSTILAGGRPDVADIKQLQEFGEKIAEKLQGAWENPIQVRGEIPIRPYFIPRDKQGNPIDMRKVKPNTKETCVDCGICVAACPMGAISKENPREVTGICIKCCACVKKCPLEAKFFDDMGFVYHKEELEELYEGRAEAEYFV